MSLQPNFSRVTFLYIRYISAFSEYFGTLVGYIIPIVPMSPRYLLYSRKISQAPPNYRPA